LLEAKDIELQAETDPDIEQVKLGMQERRDLYLIFKEAINNLAKYSKASKAKIRFYLHSNVITMIIADNGIGFDTHHPLAGNGLKNMKERAKKHRWQLNIESEPGAGTTIWLKGQ
jgi:signal transduction histidine kinase